MNKEYIKVKTNTDITNLAGSIFKAIMQSNEVEIRAIGKNSISQATKGISVCSEFFRERGKTLVTEITRSETTVDDGKQLKVVRFLAYLKEGN